MKIHNVTIGTAGHIDHGKSELIRALTGVHPDRLKEEKERGMTIDLGYSSCVTAEGLAVGVIDVPGHERFIKNMVAGASSVDLVVFVVAADDGVMPQTREHLSIMSFLGTRRGIVALTKIDLVDEETVALAAGEIRDLVRGTFLEKAPIVPVSSLTGEGLDRFREILGSMIASVEPASASGTFRMPVQRVFTAKGFGTVVTGVPVSGTVRLGDAVEILPHGFRGRIRNIQACNEPQEEGRAGRRTALNVSDVDYRSLARGDVVVAPGVFRCTEFFEAEFRFTGGTGGALENMTTVRVHTGTSETLAGIVLLDKRELDPGESALVQLRLRDPAVVVPGDRFILRLHSPMITIGGGVVVGLTPRKLKRFKSYILDRVAARRDSLHDPKEGILVEAEAWPGHFFSPGELALAINASPGDVEDSLSALNAAGDVVAIRPGLFIHRKHFDRLAAEVISFLEGRHAENHLNPYVEADAVRGRTGLESRIFAGFLAAMEKSGLVETAKGGLVRLKGFAPAPTDADIALMDRIEELVRERAAMPPTREELEKDPALAGKTFRPGEADTIIRFMVDEGRLVRVGAFLFHRSVYEEMRAAVVEVIRREGEVKFPLLRERFKTSRKWLIPLLDHLDTVGVTFWVGNKRRLKAN